MAEIILVNNRGVLLLDEDDLPLMSVHRWYLKKDRRTMYAQTGQHRDGTWTYAHQLLLPAPMGMEVDHANGNGLDCRRENLRLVTHAQNTRNRRAQVGSRSQYVGVSWNVATNKWAAVIHVEGKQRWLGVFAAEEDAARARDEAALRYFGDFARLNFP